MKTLILLSLLSLIACQSKDTKKIPVIDTQEVSEQREKNVFNITKRNIINTGDSVIYIDSYFESNADENGFLDHKNSSEFIKIYDENLEQLDYVGLIIKNGKPKLLPYMSAKKWGAFTQNVLWESAKLKIIEHNVELKTIFRSLKNANLEATEKCHLGNAAQIVSDFVENNNTNLEIVSRDFTSLDHYFQSFRLSLVFNSDGSYQSRNLIYNLGKKVPNIESNTLYAGSSTPSTIAFGSQTTAGLSLIPFEEWCKRNYKEILGYSPTGSSISYPYNPEVEQEILSKAWLKDLISRQTDGDFSSLTYPRLLPVDQILNEQINRLNNKKPYRNQIPKETNNEKH